MRRNVVIVLLLVSLATVHAAAGEWTGWVATANCSSKKMCARNIRSAEHKHCAQGCAKAGIPLVFATEDKILKIEDPEDAQKVQEYIGDKVVISGKIDGDSIKIKSVKAAKE